MYLNKLYMLMPTIVISMKQKRISTACEDIFLLIFLPIKPPITPDVIITASVIKSISGIDEDAMENIKLAV